MVETLFVFKWCINQKRNKRNGNYVQTVVKIIIHWYTALMSLQVTMKFQQVVEVQLFQTTTIPFGEKHLFAFHFKFV